MIRYFSFFLVLWQCYFAVEIVPDFTLLIPMRDGTELATDLYLPSDFSARNNPCVLIRSPPGRKTKPWQNYSSLTKEGYVVAIQDTRSAADKEGKTIPFYHDGWSKEQDGYDTVEYLAKSIFTNGSIGTCGFSAAGITQLMMAPSAPPSLKCQYIGMAWASIYHNAIFPGGQALKNQIEGWLGLYAKHDSIQDFVLLQPFYNEFWHRFNSLQVAHNVKVPGLLYAGWYDTALQGTIDAYTSRQHEGAEGARGKQKLIIGPWTHYWPFDLTFGEFSIPENGLQPPEDISPERWFAHYLKGADNKINETALVTYFVMGPWDGTTSKGNVWKRSDVWPVPSSATNFYFNSNLELTCSSEINEGTAAFVLDPANPVPTVGGRNLFLPSGPKDQQEIEKRDDVVVFTTQPLSQDLEVTGRLSLELFISSDQKDTDVAVRLTDVYPDGRSVLIADGLSKIRSAGNPEKVEVDLWSTSYVFAKGHAIRVSVSGSNYPQFECKTCEKASNKLHFGGKYASALILPVVN